MDVPKELRITERTFQRRFERKVGVVPNLELQICQFNSAFTQLNNRNYHKFSNIAFLSGPFR